ncbi:MAG: dTDP-4-dehydrorhamnose reductase [Cyanobacteria bacterium M_surface_7_m2_040]|nr:dTDP-4-dehydrorhamnose reductase [Cyanobacteria bacterium K_Offshore_0m_m2_072]MBM5810244.1 dTDP-4-dehydrorhamnose reductase [Cyanobacteria bacterium M_surface_9_m1_291]MBM5828403.1 dTDP-4-dehydrorhamnose reductase [Cyanobacteria bacterium M_surface_7_m2_040]
MKVLLTGAAGQLGQALLAAQPPEVELIATSRAGGAGMVALDLRDASACRAAVLEHRPHWVINAGAYTAVDKAEREPELAHAVNSGAPEAFARALTETGGRLLQLSTDFVFDGAQGSPYRPEQPVNPLGVYGASKAAGERAAQQLLPAQQLCILRTSWAYGPVGHNFVHTMLRLHHDRAASDQPLHVVADQVGCPTATPGLALACWTAAMQGAGGIHHWCDAGAASWYDFAVAIGEVAAGAGLLPQAADVRPITTADYPTPAQRPSYALLDCTITRRALGLTPQHWRTALAEVLQQISTEALVHP